MTQTNSTSTACPACHADDSIEVGGERLCLQCRHEWNPRDVVQPLTVVAPVLDEPDDDDDATVAAILDAATPHDVLSEPLSAAERIAEHTGDDSYLDDDDDPLLGQFMRLRDTGDLVLVVETLPIGRYVVEWPDAHRRTVAAGLLAPIEDNDSRDAERAPAVGDDNEPIVGVIATIASLTLAVGCEAVADDEDRSLLNPRIGWLPPPASDIPEVEQGAAYAVAIVVRTFNLDTEVVRQIAESLLAGAVAEAAESEPT